MTIDSRTIALISVGASVAANCQPCLKHHSGKAREAGLSDQEIQAAAEVGKAVRAGAAKQMDMQIDRLGEESAPVLATCSPGCGC